MPFRRRALCALLLGTAAPHPGHACPYLQRLLHAGEVEEGAVAAAVRKNLRLSDAEEGDALDRHRRLSDDSSDSNSASDGFTYGRMVELQSFRMDLKELVSLGVPSNHEPKNEWDGPSRYMDEADRTRSAPPRRPGFPRPIILIGSDPPLNVKGVPVAGKAAHTFLGQLLSHDMNNDLTSELGNVIKPKDIPNRNKPFLDLDTLYNFGGNEALMKHGKFLIGDTVPVDPNDPNFVPLPRDFPRNDDGTAIIADPRNDNNQVLSQMCVVFMLLHNKFFDELKDFDAAKLETIKHWQSVIQTELLPNFVDNDVLKMVSQPDYDFKLYTGDVADKNQMPVEFSTGAYRLFHSRIANVYQIGASNENLRVFPGDGEGRSAKDSLMGGQKLADDHVAQWRRRWFGDDIPRSPPTVQGAHRMDVLYAPSFTSMPIKEAGNSPDVVRIRCLDGDSSDTEFCLELDDYSITNDDGTTLTTSLPLLDVVRAMTHGLPGGIQMAKHVRDVLGVNNLDVLTMDYMRNISPFGLPGPPGSYVHDDVPLLIYLSHESWKHHGGKLLGPLGSLIVAETVCALLKKTPDNIVETSWTSRITNTDRVMFLNVTRYVGWE